jgi:hypothetical protein
MNPLMNESLCTLAEAARHHLPRAADGRPISTGSVTRWALKGVLGRDGNRCLLEHARLGGRNYTSVEAIHRFITRLSSEPPLAASATRSTPSSDAAERADRVLTRLGF